MSRLKDARRARGYFPLATRRSRAVQAARYARAIELLGDKWLLANKIPRAKKPDEGA